MAKFLDQMKASDWINLGQLGTSIVGGLSSGKANARTAEQAARDDAFQRQLQYYQLQQQARAGLGAFYNQTNADRATGRQALLNASPLGAEQELAMRMARARGLSGVAENFQPLMPASGDIAGLIRPSTNILSAFTTPDFRQTISPEATARSIAERRKALAGVDPNFQFGAMGDYGLPSLDKEVATYAQGVAADRLSRENLLQDLLVQQAKAATAFPQTMAQATPQGVPPTQSAQAPKKTSWWKKVVGTALPIAAAFIPGVGPAASMALQAAAGAAGGALTGGKKGALTGAITGAIGAKTGGLGSATGQRAAGEAASSFAKRAILQPSTLTRAAGSIIGGPVGTTLEAASPFLGGIKPYNPNAAYSRGLPVQAAISTPADFTSDILRQAGGAPSVGPMAPQTPSTFTPMQPWLGRVTPPTMGLSSGFIQQGPSVTPRLTATTLSPDLQQILEQVGRRRSTAVPPLVTPGQYVIRPGEAMRASTPAERLRDTMSPVLDVLAGLGMPGAREVSTTVPFSGSPTAEGAPLPTEQVLNTPMGMAMLMALGLGRPTAPMAPQMTRLGPSRIAGYLPEAPMGGAPSVPALPAPRTPLSLPAPASPAGLPPGQYNLPALSPSSVKTQLQLGNLLRQIEQYKNDPVAVRMLIQQMQPLLTQVR
ncbi:MAG: hypothetical protein EBS05_16850 [Proteobacteria bacterium]|nr:hypothetical protein [Pseudomonadota bacterium]